MSSKLTGAVWELDLPRPEKYVLLALADHGKEDGSDVYPSLARIEWKTGYSRTQVRDIMRQLREKGILKLVRKGGNGRGDCDQYRMEVCKAPSLADFKIWNKGTETAPIASESGVAIGDETAKGTETAPIAAQGFPHKDAESAPLSGDRMGTVPVDKGYGFTTNKGSETAPELKPNHKPRTRPSASDAADPRHKPIQKLLIDNYAGLTKLAPEKVEWDGREGKALAKWLADHPRVTLEEAAQCVNNFFASDGPVTQRLAKSIPTLLEYFACELNQFKTPRVLDRKWSERERMNSAAAVGSHRSYS